MGRHGGNGKNGSSWDWVLIATAGVVTFVIVLAIANAISYII